MRPVALCAVGLTALFAVSCGASRPASRPESGGADTLAAFTDSIESTSADDLFIEKHAALITELGKREDAAGFEARTAEVRSFLEAAEELYLRGRTAAALRLLDEARRMLRQDNAKP